MRRLNALQVQELVQLHAQSGVKLYARIVVEFARNPASALHKRFEWDDTKAAQSWRVEQARELIQLYVTVLPGQTGSMRALVSLTKDRSSGGGYRALQVVLANPTLREQLLEEALVVLENVRARYMHLTELAEVWKALDTVPRRAARGATAQADLSA